MYEDVPNGPIYAASIPHVAGQRLQLDEVSAVAIPDVMALQSPTSRGSDCNRRSSAHLRRLPGFNPLRRGAATATRRRLAPHGGDGRASIPYVAGQRLQPAGSRPGRPSPSSFNPLRRGAATATVLRALAALVLRAASIPYVAGQRLQRAPRTSRRTVPRSFNPLRRGAATATALSNS